MGSNKDGYLKEEYFKLQDQYEDYDRRALQIKGWISAGSIAGIAFSLGQDEKTTLISLLAVSAISICFWYLEAMWKMFQYSIRDRIRIIEAHFRNDPDILVKDPDPLQIYSWWFKSYVNDEPIYSYETHRPKSKIQRLWGAARQPFVHLPYSLIIIMCIVIVIFN